MKNRNNKNEGAEGGRNNPLFVLQKYHMRAIELRYEGKTFKDICGVLAVELKKGVHPDTIRKWFSRGGLLISEYLEYAKAENDQRRQMMREELKKLVTKIPTKLDQLIGDVGAGKDRDMISVMAIKTVIEVLGITADDDRATTDVLDTYFKRLEQVKPTVKEVVPKA